MSLPAALRRRATLAGGTSLVVGMGLTALSLAWMHGELAPPAPPDDRAAVAFSTPPPPKPPPKRPKPKPKKKERPRRAPPPTPSLATGLAGLDFGLPGLSGALDDATDALLGDVGDVVMTEDAVDAAPRPLERVPADYPVRARAKNVTGHVTLSLLVEADGTVDDLKVLESQPPGVFDEAAMAAVRQWRFTPATYEGRPVSVRARQTLRFELE